MSTCALYDRRRKKNKHSMKKASNGFVVIVDKRKRNDWWIEMWKKNVIKNWQPCSFGVSFDAVFYALLFALLFYYAVYFSIFEIIKKKEFFAFHKKKKKIFCKQKMKVRVLSIVLSRNFFLESRNWYVMTTHNILLIKFISIYWEIKHIHFRLLWRKKKIEWQDKFLD